MASSPWIVRCAVENAPKPNPGFTRRFAHRRSCSTNLFNYLHCLSTQLSGSMFSGWMGSKAGGYAAFKSTGITPEMSVYEA
jgi:hypothetical protein